MIGRIFYVVDRNWNSRLSAAEIRRSNLLQTLLQLEEEPDINQVRICSKSLVRVSNGQTPHNADGSVTKISHI